MGTVVFGPLPQAQRPGWHPTQRPMLQRPPDHARPFRLNLGEPGLLQEMLPNLMQQRGIQGRLGKVSDRPKPEPPL